MTKELNIEQERREFEALVQNKNANFEQYSSYGVYKNRDTENVFQGYLLAKRAAMVSSEPVAWDIRYKDGSRWLLCRNKPDLKELVKEAGESAKDAICRPLIYDDTAAQSADEKPIDENELWDLLDAVSDELSRRAAPHSWESVTRQAGFDFIIKRRAAIAAKESA